MGDDIVTDGLGLSVQLHDALVQDLVLRLHVRLLLVHSLRLLLSLLQRVLQHDFLFIKLLLLGLELAHASGEELDLLLPLVQLVMQVLRQLLLFLGLVANSTDLRLDLEDLVITLLDQLLDSLESLVTLLHAEQTLLPVFEKGLLGHDNALDLNSSLFEGVPGGSGLFLLRDELGLVEGLLLVKALDFFVHGIDQQILLLLGLLQVGHVLLSSVGCAPSHGDFTLHHFVVLFNLLKRTIKLVKLFLGFEDSLELFVSLFLFALVLALKDFMLALSLGPVTLHDVVVVVSALESGLHAGQLVLDSVKLHTGLFTGLTNLADGLFALTQLEIHSLVLVRQLLGQSVLQTSHERLNNTDKASVTFPLTPIQIVGLRV